MTGYERIVKTLRNEPTDRPPFDFWAEEPTLNRLFEYLGHRDLERFLDEMQVDVRAFNAIEPQPRHIGDGIYENMWGERFIYRETGWGAMREDTYGALNNAESLEDIAAFRWPDNDVMDYSQLREQCISARNKNLAVRYGFADIWQRPALVRGLEKFMTDMVLNPDWVHWLCRKFTDFYLEEYCRAWEISGGNIDIFLVISDLGTQRGPLISAKMFESFVAPYLTEMTYAIHKMGAKVMFHSCGNIAKMIPAIIRCGVDILNPLQPTGADMSPVSLKSYAGQICFHGGIDVQRLIPTGSTEEIKNEIRRYADIFGKGYIACPAHFFQPDTPAENIVAFYEAFN